MSLLIPLLRESTIDRHNKAVRSLRDGSMTVTITRRTESEIRALVKNGASLEYGVTLTEHGPFCSCRDALYRGTMCKHSVAVALFCLQEQEAEKNQFHLTWSDGQPLCHATPTPRIWVYPWTDYMLTWPEACSACVTAYKHPMKVAA